MSLPIKIAPSILSADFGNLNQDISTVEPYADLLHIDVMDGHFVPNLSFGVPVLKKIKTKLPLDCHLMIHHPWQYIKDFAEVGADIITVHQEALLRRSPDNHFFTCQQKELANLPKDLKNSKLFPDLPCLINIIKSFNVKAGISINPNTPLESIYEILDLVDLVLIMSVIPGFGGQNFMMDIVPKIQHLRKLKPTLDIEVDGGINKETAKIVRNAGANILVAGSYIFGAQDRQTAIASLRE